METSFWIFVLLGFVAQIIDGGVGMGFGIITNTVLLSLGIPPVVSSASVHTAGIFTSGLSGLSHWRLGNINKKLFLTLVFPGIIGAFIGSRLMQALPRHILKPAIGAYLLIIGIILLYRAFKMPSEDNLASKYPPFGWIMYGLLTLLKWGPFKKVAEMPTQFLEGLALTGGSLDAIGGGGWGPIVTSILLLKEQEPRTSIGSVNAAEFFVALTTSITLFAGFPSKSQQTIIGGLILGGMVAAPLGAFALRFISKRVLLFIVGGVMTTLTTFNLLYNWL
ncbi:MAG TPA: sulfite exporter TauE/SafE family protein [Candidatus Gracilibacteria bacterium]